MPSRNDATTHRRQASPVAKFVDLESPVDGAKPLALDPISHGTTAANSLSLPTITPTAAAAGPSPGARRPARHEEPARARPAGKAATAGAAGMAPAPRVPSVHADTRREGWGIIGKITPFVHAVGRVSDGRGSAILVALPERGEKEWAVASSNAQMTASLRRLKRRGRAGRSGTPLRGQPLWGTRGSSAAARASPFGGGGGSARQCGAFAASVGWDPLLDDAEAAMHGDDADGLVPPATQTPLAVVLTTSAVLDSREGASGVFVTFMEQPVAGTAAQLGREPMPFSVALRSDVGFVCSVAPSERRRRQRGAAQPRTACLDHADSAQREGLHWGEDTAAAAGVPQRDASNRFPRTHSLQSSVSETDGASGGWGDGARSCRPPANRAVGRPVDWDDSSGDEDIAEEIGYALSFCELEPRGAGGGSASTDEAFSTRGHHRSRAAASPSLSRSSTRGIHPLSGWRKPGTFAGSNATGTATPGARSLSGTRLSSSAVAESISNVTLKQHKTDSVFLVKPLPLPLLLSAIQPVHAGDTHLMVTHVDGRERRYVVQHVSTVHHDFCEYEDDATLPGDYSSGGPVFNMNGDFIGLQHRHGGQSICMFTASIVKNLFHANKLGMCRTPISNQPLPDDGTFGQRVVTAMEHVPEEVFNQPASFTQQSSVTDVGVEGGRLINFDDLERIRRYHERPVPLTERKPSYSEVFKEFFSDFSSLTHMLNAFYYCPALTAKVLETMVSAKYREELQTVASSGGVGMVLEMMDGYPDMESLVTTALSALSRMCLHTHNLAAFVTLDGVATVLEMMKEYPHSAQILQWGAYCLAHVTRREAPSVRATVDVLLRCNVVELAASALRAHGKAQGHMSRWLCVVLANVAAVEPRAVTLYVQEELPAMVVELASHFSCDSSVLARLLALLSTILQPLCDELPAPLASLEEHRQYEELRPFVCTSPLSVSAYFVYMTLAHLPVAPLDAEEVLREAESFDGEGRCRCQHCPLCRCATDEAKATEEGATAGPCHCRLSVPRTTLNRILMAMLDRESRERRNSASVDLLAICLDVLLVLDAWGLFPVHFAGGDMPSSIFSFQADGAPREVGLAAAASQSHDRVVAVASPSADATGAQPGTSDFVTYGFASCTLQEVLDRIKRNYSASEELMARLDQFMCTEREDM